VGSEVRGRWVSNSVSSLIASRSVGRLEAALQETADRLGTPDFSFFTITLAIQRTAVISRDAGERWPMFSAKRAQMKLKIRAMSSESKASGLHHRLAALLRLLPSSISSTAIICSQFFEQTRLIVAEVWVLVWMAIGAFVMAKMISFEV